MKANAPEKIYLQPSTIEELPHQNIVYTKPLADNSIEYTRTDAFIEKARKWFEKQNEWRDINGIKHCDMESFDDFRKYMEE